MIKNNIVIENAKSKNNLPEGIRQKADGTYNCRINIKDAEGRWKNIEMSGFITVTEAQTARTLMQAKLIENPALLAIKECKLTMSELYNEFISKEAKFHREKSTLARYASLQHNHIDPKWGNRGIRDVKPQEVTDYLFELTKTLSYAYIMNIHKYIRVLFKFAVSREYMAVNPIDKVIPPIKRIELEESQNKIYTQAELDTLENRFASTNLLSAFKLGRDLGVRCGECFGLLWSDIDWDKHTIKVNKQLVYEDRMWCLQSPKTIAAIREIELQDSIYNYLKELKVKQEQQKAVVGIAYKETRVVDCTVRNKNKEIVTNLDFINIKPNGELLTPDSAKVLTKIASIELGYNFKYHNLRHTHASELAIKEVSILAVKERLGHTRVETTARYFPQTRFPAEIGVLDLVDKGGLV